MNTIKVLREFNHEGKKIYIMRIGTIFEYLLLYDNKLFQNYIVVKPIWYRRFFKEPFTEEQIESTVKLLLEGAKTTLKELDKLNAKK